MENTNILNIKEFVYLLLATLAQDSKIIDLNDKNIKTISLPIQYKQIIQNILCADNGWKEEFSILIDIEEYFENHFVWEQKLALTLKKVLVDLNKTFEYDFEYDRLLIKFTCDEIDSILMQYNDDELKSVMEHFVNLLTDYIFTREFQEEHHDYYAYTVDKMHEMNTSEFSDEKRKNISKKSNMKIKSLLKKINYYGIK